MQRCTSTVTKYYYLGDQRVAMRQGNTLYYLHTDHLGSTSLVTNDQGGEVARQRYYPYGGSRSSSGTLPTDYRFTGQRQESGIGLYDYGARFYDPVLGRFVSADTLVPEPGNPQSLNRYSYCLGNPLAGGDPTGHQGPIPGAGSLPWQSGFSLPSISPEAVQALSVAAPVAVPIVTAATAGTVFVYYGSMWAIQDRGPNYTVPLEFNPGSANATYALPGYYTVGAPTMIGSPLMYSDAMTSMADHLGFLFDAGPGGLPGFPDPEYLTELADLAN